MAFDLIVFGHLTHDTIVTPDKRTHKTLGGVAAYTSLTAAKLGAVVGDRNKGWNGFQTCILGIPPGSKH